jgi:hypothetical protein
MYTTNRLDPMGGPTIGFVSWFRNGHLGSNGSRAVEDAERGLYPCLSMFILLLDCLTF